MMKRMLIGLLAIGLFYVLGGCDKPSNEAKMDAASSDSHEVWGTYPKKQSELDAKNKTEWNSAGEVGRIPSDPADPWNKVHQEPID
jgi:hypothetical protein